MRNGKGGKGLPKREEFLAWLLETPEGEATGPLDDARRRFHEVLRTGTAFGPIEWLFNQLIGTPRTTVVQTIENGEFVAAAARVTARYLRPDKFEAWWIEVKAELGETGV